MRPADACPFARPFPAGFDQCPTFAHEPFLVRDSQHRELAVVGTCRHLTARSLDGGLAGYYAACGIGDAAARERHAKEGERRRAAEVRKLGRDLGESTRELTRQLWEVKGEQLRARREGRRTESHTRRMQSLRAAYEEHARAFFIQRAARLRELDVPEEACVALVVGILDEWITTPSLEGAYAPSRDLLSRFPVRVRTLAMPNTTARPAGVST